MAKRMALVPSDFLSRYYQQKPEFILEDEIENLLNKSKLPDEMKVKLLSELTTKYHQAVHNLQKPIPVSITSEDNVQSLASDIKESLENKPHIAENSHFLGDPIYNQIVISVPPSYKKYLSTLISALKNANYTWNQSGELVINDKIVPYTHVADLFSYISRNSREDIKPVGLSNFIEGIKKANVPLHFIIRKDLKEKLSVNKYTSKGSAKVDEKEVDSDYFPESKFTSTELLVNPKSSSDSDSVKWLRY